MNGLADVLAEILAGIGVRLADVGFGREIDHVGDAVLADDLLNKFTIFNVALVKGTELGGPAMAGAEIVQNDRLAPGFREQFTSVATDVTGAAGYQDRTCHSHYGVLAMLCRYASLPRKSYALLLHTERG